MFNQLLHTDVNSFSDGTILHVPEQEPDTFEVLESYDHLLATPELETAIDSQRALETDKQSEYEDSDENIQSLDVDGNISTKTDFAIPVEDAISPMAIETDNPSINWVVSKAAATEVINISSKNACNKLDPLEEDVLDLENQTGECGWYYSPIKLAIETANDSPMALENDPSTKLGF